MYTTSVKKISLYTTNLGLLVISLHGCDMATRANRRRIQTLTLTYIRHQGTIICYCERFMYYGKLKLFPICLKLDTTICILMQSFKVEMVKLHASSHLVSITKV